MTSQSLIVGKKINSWTLIGRGYHTQKSGKKVLYWKCRCVCGTEALVAGSDLRSNKSTRCRNCNGTMPDDISGKRYGEWSVISCNITKLRRRYCKCRCSCGDIYEVAAQTVKNGSSTKCLNCYTALRDGANYTRHPLYQIWKSMHNRCELKTNSAYKYYGARGIKVCSRWDDFQTFVKDIKPRPSKSHSVDRINNDGNYEPSNCKWATPKQQGRNKRSNHFETHDGVTKTRSEWAGEFGVKDDTLYRFLTRNSFECAYNHYKYGSKGAITMTAWDKRVGCSLIRWHANHLNVCAGTIRLLLGKGNTISDAYSYYSISKTERVSIVSKRYQYNGKKIAAGKLSLELNTSLCRLVVYLHEHPLEYAIDISKKIKSGPRGKVITYKGVSKTAREWATELNVIPDTLWHFLIRNSFEKAYKHYSTINKLFSSDDLKLMRGTNDKQNCK